MIYFDVDYNIYCFVVGRKDFVMIYLDFVFVLNVIKVSLKYEWYVFLKYGF